MKTVLKQIINMHSEAMLPSRTKENRKAIHEAVKEFVRDTAPYPGGGDDSEVELLEISKQKMIIEVNIHHLNKYGKYTGWSRHKVIIQAVLPAYTINVTSKESSDASNAEVKEAYIKYFDSDMSNPEYSSLVAYSNKEYNYDKEVWE